MLRVRGSQRRVLAENVTAIAGRSAKTAPVGLTLKGRRLSAVHRWTRATLGVDFRDVLEARAGALAPGGTLR